MKEIIQQKTSISILIICREINEARAALAVNNLASKFFEFEILIAEGDNPSMQRNELARLASGQYLLFLDDDSIPDHNIFSSYAEALRTFPEAMIFGGPSVLQTDKDILGTLSGLFFSSWIGLGPFRGRYISQGEMRQTTERELILCNLLINRELFVKSGGFHRNLYPNEENELLKRMKRREPAIAMIYHPGAIVFRRARGKLPEFCKQLFSYGQGRSKHINLLREPKDIIFFLPLLLALYVLFLVAVQSMHIFLLLPLVLYVLIVTVSSLINKKYQNVLIAFISPLFFLLGHICYGIGFATGLIKYLVIRRFFFKDRKFTKLTVKTIKKFTNC